MSSVLLVDPKGVRAEARLGFYSWTERALILVEPAPVAVLLIEIMTFVSRLR